MNRFGLPLVPSALALWAINFIDRLFVERVQGPVARPASTRSRSAPRA